MKELSAVSYRLSADFKKVRLVTVIPSAARNLAPLRWLGQSAALGPDKERDPAPTRPPDRVKESICSVILRPALWAEESAVACFQEDKCRCFAQSS